MEHRYGQEAMTTRFSYLGLGLGVIGLCLGVGALVTGTAILGLLAGLCALGASGACLYLDRVAGGERAARAVLADELTAMRDEAETASSKADEAEANLVGTTPEAEKRVLPPPRVSGPKPAEPSVAEFIEAIAPIDPTADNLIDAETGLFSESFFRVALDGRIAAARRHLRPVAMVLLEVVRGLPGDPEPVEAPLVADTVKQTLREADTACRLHSGYFALLLEDTPENGAIWTVERIRRHLLTGNDGLTVWAGVACYPAHAFSPEELLSASETALVAAREWRQDRIEVATAAD